MLQVLLPFSFCSDDTDVAKADPATVLQYGILSSALHFIVGMFAADLLSFAQHNVPVCIRELGDSCVAGVVPV